jgi:hypothetical protein
MSVATIVLLPIILLLIMIIMTIKLPNHHKYTFTTVIP